MPATGTASTTGNLGLWLDSTAAALDDLSDAMRGMGDIIMDAVAPWMPVVRVRRSDAPNGYLRDYQGGRLLPEAVAMRVLMLRTAPAMPQRQRRPCKASTLARSGCWRMAHDARWRPGVGRGLQHARRRNGV